MKTLFIDFGNVLGFFDHRRAVAQLLPYTPLDQHQLDRAIYAAEAMNLYESGRMTTDEFVRRSLDAGRLSCSPERFVEAFADIFEPNPEVCDLVPGLAANYRLVLASNTCEAHFARYCRDFAPTLSHFHHLCASHLGNARKPELAFYEYCQRHALADPGDCLFIDDLPGHIDAGRSHGWRTLHYHTPGTLARELELLGVRIPRIP